MTTRQVRAAAEARARIRNTSNLCLRKLHDQCVADICECECHHRPTRPTLVEQPGPLEAAIESAPEVLAAATDDGEGGCWEAPPGFGRPRQPRIPAAERALVDANPGRWRRVKIYGGDRSAHSARIHMIKSGEVTLDDYELRASRLPEGGSAIYLRRKEPTDA